jgi:hypothetical protein
MFIFLSKNKKYMLTVQDIKNKKIKGAWKGRIEMIQPKSEGIVTTIIVKVEETKSSKNE